MMGRVVEVKIATTGKHYLIGERVRDSMVALTTRPRPALKGAVSGVSCSGSLRELRTADRRKGNLEPAKDRRTVLLPDVYVVFGALTVVCMCIGIWLRCNNLF